jgi:peptide-methionine (R)-S-oxide reductase
MKYFILSFMVIFGLYVSCKSNKQIVKASSKTDTNQDITYFVNQRGDTIPKISLSDTQWKQILTEQEYNVLRLKGTEKAFTSDLLNKKVDGLYTCRGCGMPLFASRHKFDSGTGWPSFFQILEKNIINTNVDYDLGYARSELTCAKCDGHLGHVFNDGPKPTGLRYCINGVSLDFVKSEN